MNRLRVYKTICSGGKQNNETKAEKILKNKLHKHIQKIPVFSLGSLFEIN